MVVWNVIVIGKGNGFCIVININGLVMNNVDFVFCS